MHPTAQHAMEKFAAMLPGGPLKIVDVGSYDVNGTFKPIFARPGIEYVGLDIRSGPNVDVVIADDFKWPNISSESFDAVISGSTLEHTKLPWLFVLECARILKRGGLICINAPYHWGFHEHPIDCWRVYPDGMKAVMEWAGLTVIEVWKDQCYREEYPEQGLGDTTGIARKP
jgi:SAM-dependent methyltransferase